MIQTTEMIQLEDRRKFIKLGKDFFFHNPDAIFDPIDESQKTHKLLSLDLPSNIAEPFLSIENLTLYLIDYLKFMRNKNSDFAQNKETLSNYLLRWFFSKSNTEKEAIFHSLIKFGSGSDLSLFDELLLSSFLIREKKSIKEPKFIKNKVELLNSLNDTQQARAFGFWIMIVKSFYHISMSEWEAALYSINDLEHFNSYSPNATFYKCHIMLAINNFEQAEELIEKIAAYDLKRLEYAIDNFNFKAFDFFLQNSFLQNTFALNDGPLLFNKLSTVNFIIQKKIELLPKISKMVKDLDLDRLKEFKDDNLINHLSFIIHIINRYAGSKNYHFLSSLEYLEKKIKFIISGLIHGVTDKYDMLINNILCRYDEKINRNNDLLKTLEENRDEYLKKIESKIQKLLGDFQIKINNEIQFYENQIANFETDYNHSSFNSLKNSFIYNGLLSLFVLLSGGFAEYSNSYLTDIANFTSIVSIVIMGGLKWGAIAFFIGLIISMYLLFAQMHKKFILKNNLIRKISNLSSEKERGIAEIKNRIEQEKRDQIDRYEFSKKRFTEEIESLKASKEQDRKSLIDKFGTEKNELIAPLKVLIKD